VFPDGLTVNIHDNGGADDEDPSGGGGSLPHARHHIQVQASPPQGPLIGQRW